MQENFKLGLIGDNISRSRSPELHRYCGTLCGLAVSYDLFSPALAGITFEEMLTSCRNSGVQGVNVTFPFKEIAIGYARVNDPYLTKIGALNTLLFRDGETLGFNTDYTGFIAAYEARFGEQKPGRVALIGSGGVGRAIGFALVVLGADEIIISDLDQAKASLLAASLRESGAKKITVAPSAVEAVQGVDGVINSTPLGMYAFPGSPLPAGVFPTNAWAFDAVYVPIETLFRDHALKAGANFLSGYELFFHQGVIAFKIFTGQYPPNLDKLREMLIRNSKQSIPTT